jgi:dTDP-4-dehydrorhamnose 3,5-epimerase
MPFIETPIKDLFIFEPRVFNDSRGYFFESFNQKLFTEIGVNAEFVQDNQSYSLYGTLRGLHFQTGEMAQAKLVRVLQGRVLDVVVDLRPISKTFGAHFSVELSAENKKQLYIPRGFAHGFVVLSEAAEFFYKVDNFYSPQHEAGILYSDNTLNIDWKVPVEKIMLADKDKLHPSFEDYKKKL